MRRGFRLETDAMAVYECECGLIISTTSNGAQCLRCHQVLGIVHRLRRVDTTGLADTVVMTLDRDTQACNVTLPFRVNERPVVRRLQGR
jgi:hypothetical protein